MRNKNDPLSISRGLLMAEKLKWAEMIHQKWDKQFQSVTKIGWKTSIGKNINESKK